MKKLIIFSINANWKENGIFGMREPTPPGEILQKEFLDPHKLSRKNLAEHLGWNVKRIDRICNNEASITPQIALALGAAFGVNGEFWLSAQMMYDLWVARQEFKTAAPLPHATTIKQFKIEKHIYLAPPVNLYYKKKKRISKYPFLLMNVEDSFLIPCANMTNKQTVRNLRAAILIAAAKFNKKHGVKYKFKTRSAESGIRIWRVE